jgi:hypothetical protein
MNRRSFLSGILLKTGLAFTILPGAGRLWKAQAQIPDGPYAWVYHSFCGYDLGEFPDHEVYEVARWERSDGGLFVKQSSQLVLPDSEIAKRSRERRIACT